MPIHALFLFVCTILIVIGRLFELLRDGKNFRTLVDLVRDSIFLVVYIYLAFFQPSVEDARYNTRIAFVLMQGMGAMWAILYIRETIKFLIALLRGK